MLESSVVAQTHSALLPTRGGDNDGVLLGHGVEYVLEHATQTVLVIVFLGAGPTTTRAAASGK